jgi:hypothetical protein
VFGAVGEEAEPGDRMEAAGVAEDEVGEVAAGESDTGGGGWSSCEYRVDRFLHGIWRPDSKGSRRTSS